jgi:hypothetical protein
MKYQASLLVEDRDTAILFLSGQHPEAVPCEVILDGVNETQWEDENVAEWLSTPTSDKLYVVPRERVMYKDGLVVITENGKLVKKTFDQLSPIPTPTINTMECKKINHSAIDDLIKEIGNKHKDQEAFVEEHGYYTEGTLVECGMKMLIDWVEYAGYTRIWNLLSPTAHRKIWEQSAFKHGDKKSADAYLTNWYTGFYFREEN